MPNSSNVDRASGNTAGYSWIGMILGGPIGMLIGLAAGVNGQNQAAAQAREEELQRAREAAAVRELEQNRNEALLYASDNNKTTALAQIQNQSFALQQASLDREMQLAANLELGLEKFDTKLQVSLLEYRQQMTAEENRHVEKIAQAGKGLQQIQSTYSLGADLPPPDEETL